MVINILKNAVMPTVFCAEFTGHAFVELIQSVNSFH